MRTTHDSQALTHEAFLEGRYRRGDRVEIDGRTLKWGKNFRVDEQGNLWRPFTPDYAVLTALVTVMLTALLGASFLLSAFIDSPLPAWQEVAILAPAFAVFSALIGRATPSRRP